MVFLHHPVTVGWQGENRKCGHGEVCWKLAPAQLEAGMLIADPGVPTDWVWVPSRSDFGVTFRYEAGPLRCHHPLPPPGYSRIPSSHHSC